jgi:2-succinyl-5-enolpyruvyl-6-hydroxy-3-cyclohexene-1-carboxylate synthase
MISDKQPVQDLTGILVAHGLKHVVISPGSRHAPIALSFYNHPDVKCYVVPDERAGGYFALGIAQATGSAVAVLCTSGTAALNYGPAIAEAFYQEVPLLVVSADRPDEWIDQGDGQTIRQSGVHAHHTLASFDISADGDHLDVQRAHIRKINAAWNIANGKPRGPVHINVALREPLYLTVEAPGRAPQRIDVIASIPQLPEADLIHLQSHLAKAHKVMLLTGLCFPDAAVQEAVQRFADHTNVVVLTETSSNVTGEHLIPCIDRLLMSTPDEGLADLVPDVLITFGNNVVSKKIKAFLRQHFTGEHWHIDPAGRALDTYKKLRRVLTADVAGALHALAGAAHPAVQAETPYRTHWITIDRKLALAQREILDQTPWSDLAVFDLILPRLPKHSVLQMGNSSVVRYIQLFDPRTDLQYFGNRGTSGIDGCTATASGMAAVSDRMVTLISGDIAFLYDVNGLWHNASRENLRIIVVNNGGGNIFKIIDGPSSTNALETVFEARHDLTARSIAAHFGLNYYAVANADELTATLPQFYAAGQGAAVLEVDTRDVANERVLHQMFKQLKDRITQQ